MAQQLEANEDTATQTPNGEDFRDLMDLVMAQRVEANEYTAIQTSNGEDFMDLIRGKATVVNIMAQHQALQMFAIIRRLKIGQGLNKILSFIIENEL